VGAFVLVNVIGVGIRVYRGLRQNRASSAYTRGPKTNGARRGAKRREEAYQEDAYREETHYDDARQEEPVAPNRDSLAPYRELFGLPAQYTEAELKTNYRTLAAKYHPDHNTTAGSRKKQNAEDMMKKINEGYTILKKNIDAA
jgi:hypothetical protein